MYFDQIKCRFYTQNGCMNKTILQRLIPSQIPDRKFYKYNINISHNKTTGLRNSFDNSNVNNM
jgi:hypothetical protein